jgi:predicted PurR-regulated permease PerM
LRLPTGVDAMVKMEPERANRLYRFGFVLALAVAASALFLFLIHTFIVDLVLAAIFAGLITPFFRSTARFLGGRAGAAAAVIVLAVLLAIALPLAAVTTVVVSQAIQLSSSTMAWIQQAVTHPQSVLAALPASLATSPELSAAVTWFLAHAASVVGSLAGYLSASLSGLLRGASRLFLDFFVMAFALVYFLQHGPALIALVEERIPVARPDAQAIVDRTLKITAATLRSIVIGGAVDGALVGVGVQIRHRLLSARRSGVGRSTLLDDTSAIAAIR